jgi:hypothetical protein
MDFLHRLQLTIQRLHASYFLCLLQLYCKGIVATVDVCMSVCMSVSDESGLHQHRLSKSYEMLHRICSPYEK